MINLLCEMNRERKAAIKEKRDRFETAVLSGYEKKYDDLIALGRTENKKQSTAMPKMRRRSC